MNLEKGLDIAACWKEFNSHFRKIFFKIVPAEKWLLCLPEQAYMLLYFHCSVVSLLRSVFDEKLRERRGPRFALDKGITECRKFELYNAKLDIYSVLHFIIHSET